MWLWIREHSGPRDGGRIRTYRAVALGHIEQTQKTKNGFAALSKHMLSFLKDSLKVYRSISS